MVAALVIFAILANHAAAAAPEDFTGPGPCAVDAAPHTVPVTLPPDSGCRRDCHLQLHITGPAPARPAAGAAAAGAPAGGACAPGPAGFPLLFFFSGFQLRASFYENYAQRLASWGWVVVRYDLAVLDLVPSATQVAYVPHLLEVLKQLNTDLSSRWYKQLDTDRLAAAGHSRGGKLAALHLAAAAPPLFSAAYLIDPVDSDTGPEDPSAIEALRGLNRSVGISAAAIEGPCNPGDRTRGFWEVAGPGSWRERLVRGGHVQFCNITSAFVEKALDLLCGHGGDSHEAVVELTLPPMVAWLEHARGGDGAAPRPPPPAPRWRRGARRAPPAATQQWRRLLFSELPWLQRVGDAAVAAEGAAGVRGAGFWDWVDGEERQGEIEFEVKP